MKISYDIPIAKDYCELRLICGLSSKDQSAAEIGLKNSLFCVTIREPLSENHASNSQLIAMGRVVGDLGCFIQVVDIAVHPSFQKQGLSRKIMEELMSFIDEKVPVSCLVSLFADVEFLYEKFGFVPSGNSKGMFLRRAKVMK